MVSNRRISAIMRRRHRAANEATICSRDDMSIQEQHLLANHLGR